MDRIKIGDRFRPLENSPAYGTKCWKKDAEGVWVEQVMTQEEKDFDRLESMLVWAGSAFPWCRSPPITEADCLKEPGLKAYIDGFAIFPSVRGYPIGSPEQNKVESEWEKRSLAMHAAQEPIKLDDKPEDNRLEEIALAKIALERGD